MFNRTTVLSSLFVGVILLMLFPFASMAQYDFTMQGQSLVPQRNYLNPAFIPETQWHFGLPLLSSNHISGGLSAFAYSDVIKKTGNDSLFIDVESALAQMPSTGYLSLSVNLDLLSFSFKFGPEHDNLLFFNVTERVSLRMSFPKDLLNFAWKGNGAFLGETVDFSKLNVDASHYREYGATYARQLLEKRLSVGLTAKYLYGMENVSSSKSNLNVFTDPNSFDITANSDFQLNSTGLLTDDAFDNFSNGEIVEYAFQRNNHGFAFNVGAHYKGKENWEIAASVLDLGVIFWKDNPLNYKMDNATFTYAGMDIAQFLATDDNGDFFQEFGDSLIDAFDLEETNEGYSNMLATRFNVNGAYNFTERDRLGVDFYGELFKNHFEPAAALNYTHKFGTVLHLSASYMYNNHSFANLGFGFSLRAGRALWFFNVDNILAPIIPQHSQNFHFHSGLNFLLKDREQKKESDRDGDGIVDKLDICPDEFGLEAFAGCPDRDLDSIPDVRDNCPDEFGPIENGGCPWGDKDEDGLIDNEDDCPNEAGPKENGGCPWGDKDNDGVTDNIDECDTIAGPVENKGCPWGDRDEDGVLDNEDKCPDTPGPVENKGCPWGDRDGDGVLDNEDRCPDVPGPVDNEGCPYQDSDGDGVIDIEDECPRTPGTVENKGCPVIKKEEQEVLNTAFNNLEFESGSNVIKGSSYGSLDELAILLAKKPEYKLKISGHTDSDGSAESNLKLSEKRSKAVVSYLNNRGVNTTSFVVEWFGEAKPLYPNDTREGKAKNRRVEMEVIFD